MTVDVSYDAVLICIDDTRRNARHMREVGVVFVHGHRCAECGCSLLVEDVSETFARTARVAFACLRCARAATGPGDLCDGLVPGAERIFHPEVLAAHLRRPLHDLLDTAARNSMGAQG